MDDGSFGIEKRNPFASMGAISGSDVASCFSFAFDMTFGGKGQHRNKRENEDSGRDDAGVFANAFQGKLAEYAFYRMMRRNGVWTSSPDISVCGCGKWDVCDFEVENRTMAIKSTKHFGNLLLLEKTDWNADGTYKYGMDPKTGSPVNVFYDAVVMMRIRPDCETVVSCALSPDATGEKPDPFVALENASKRIVWEYDIPGFVTGSDLKQCIGNGFVLSKGQFLRTTKMKVDNYYIQSGDLRPINDIFSMLVEAVELSA